jgi:hypothetical protein
MGVKANSSNNDKNLAFFSILVFSDRYMKKPPSGNGHPRILHITEHQFEVTVIYLLA